MPVIRLQTSRTTFFFFQCHWSCFNILWWKKLLTWVPWAADHWLPFFANNDPIPIDRRLIVDGPTFSCNSHRWQSMACIVQPGATKCNQVQISATRCNKVHIIWAIANSLVWLTRVSNACYTFVTSRLLVSTPPCLLQQQSQQSYPNTNTMCWMSPQVLMLTLWIHISFCWIYVESSRIFLIYSGASTPTSQASYTSPSAPTYYPCRALLMSCCLELQSSPMQDPQKQKLPRNPLLPKRILMTWTTRTTRTTLRSEEDCSQTAPLRLWMTNKVHLTNWTSTMNLSKRTLWRTWVA